jgi:hypothetical protein
MKFNLFSIVIIIVIIYVICYFIFPSYVLILETSITDFNFSQLTSRQPLIITDFLKDAKPLIESWFKYNIITQIPEIKEENKEWEYNKYKYLFVKAKKNTEVIIYKASVYKNPPTEEDRIIAIKLKENQSLIIPYRWKYFIKTKEEVEIWGIDDYITFFVGLVF